LEQIFLTSVQNSIHRSRDITPLTSHNIQFHKHKPNGVVLWDLSGPWMVPQQLIYRPRSVLCVCVCVCLCVCIKFVSWILKWIQNNINMKEVLFLHDNSQYFLICRYKYLYLGSHSVLDTCPHKQFLLITDTVTSQNIKYFFWIIQYYPKSPHAKGGMRRGTAIIKIFYLPTDVQ
jgi:hypothetical protein